LAGYDGEIENFPGTWTLTGDIGTLSRRYGTSTILNLTKPGIGSITVTDGIYTTVTGLITVGLGKLDHFCIEALDHTKIEDVKITTDDTCTFYVRGYDADNNRIGDIASTWTVTNNIEPPTPGYGTSATFDPSKPGVGSITVTNGQITSTIPITINVGALHHVCIEYFDGIKTGATQTTTQERHRQLQMIS
jgi:hypothetical protein